MGYEDAFATVEILGLFNQGKVNIQDFLQVFQGSGIGKMEDNLTSPDLLSYTTNGSRVDLVRVVRLEVFQV